MKGRYLEDNTSSTMALSSSRRKSGKGSSRKRTSSDQAAEPREKKQKSTAAAVEEPLFIVSKIVGTKKGKDGVKLYKTRWEGYTPADDTWEPLENVSATGHVDRYERKQRALTLSTYTPGVAVIEYDDGERQTIDLLQEKFRSWMEISDNERDDDNYDVNNFDLIYGGAMIELLWPHAEIYFSCKVISWTPIVEGNDIKKSNVKRHGSLVWDMADGEKVEGEMDTRRQGINTPLLAKGAAADCRKCQMELKSGKVSRRKHSDFCPVLKRSGCRPADRERVETTNRNEAPKINSRRDEKEVAVDHKRNGRRDEKEVAVDDKRNDSAMKHKSRHGEEESVAEVARDEAPIQKKRRSTKGSASDDKSSGRRDEKEVAVDDKRNDRKDEKEVAVDKGRTADRERLETTKRNEAPKKKSRRDEKEVAVDDKRNDSAMKQKSRPGEEESVAEVTRDEVPFKKKKRRSMKGSAPEDKGEGVHTKKRSRSGERNNAAGGGSDDVPMKKKSRSSKKERTEIVTKKKSHVDHVLLKMESVSNKTSAQGKNTTKLKRQKGGHVSNGNAYAKKPATHPGQISDVSTAVSDDNGGAISKGFRKRNVSEGSIDTSLFGNAIKQSTSTRALGSTESLPNDMDIDALAVLVSMRQSQPEANSATNKHDDDSQAASKDDDNSHLDSDHNKKQKAKMKVGRGIPLYSDDEYDTSEDEWRGEKEFFQPAAHPRDGPKKMSFEEMWMMKLQQTQSIMDRNSGCRRW